MRLQFNAERHEYSVDGKIIAGVTTIIRPLSNFDGIPAAVMDRARQEGQGIHSMVELEEEGAQYVCPDWLIPFRESWRKFKADSGWLTDASEKRLYHPGFRYAGTCDLCGTAERLPKLKGRGIIDLKRSLYDDVATGVQLAGYAEAENATQKQAMRIQWRAGLKLQKDGNYRFQVFESKSDWPTFLACLTVNRWLQEHRA